MRTAALGLLGLLLAVVVGYGVHLITRDTISLPVVQLEQPAPLAPPAATSAARNTTAETETGGTTTEDRALRVAFSITSRTGVASGRSFARSQTARHRANNARRSVLGSGPSNW